MDILELKESFQAELSAISRWWLTHAVDSVNGGFLGEVDQQNRANPEANKGIIQNTRILWYFSEAAIFTDSAEDKAAAQRAYQYLCDFFIDKQYGGVFWALDCHGRPVSERKQIYGHAFAIYALSAYYRLSGDGQAQQLALQLFDLIEQHGRDRRRGGYLEAFSREWAPIEDVRLSEKDMNWPKTMNTHLHILEAYTALYIASPSEHIGQALRGLIDLFSNHFIDQHHHLRSFLDDDWRDKSDTYSYGHDIECSWLLWEAVQALGSDELSGAYEPVVVAIAQRCLAEAIGENGEVMDGFNHVKGECLRERVWWIQAEAMVGFLNAYELTNNPAYFAAFERIWQFVRAYQIDQEYGEWRWLSILDTPNPASHHKAGFWKGPYHNGRAMMEVCKRLSLLSRLPSAERSSPVLMAQTSLAASTSKERI